MFTKLILEAEIQAKQHIKAEEGDYIKDGLLYCGKCNTPKQWRGEFNGRILTPFCVCKCEAARLAAEAEELKKQERIRRIKELRKMGFPDAEMQRWTFDADDKTNERITNIAHNYVKNFAEMKKRSKGLLLFGTVGTGKTFAAASIANALIDKGIPCLVTNFARLVNTIQGMYEDKQEYIDGLNRFDLLIIDDLASERATEYMQETIQSIVDARYRAGLPLIVTTNLTSEELKNPADIRKQRIYSRLLEMCLPVEVKGKDRRKEKLKQAYKDLNDMLGI